MTDKKIYKFFYKTFKYEGYIIDTDKFHITIYDFVKKANMKLPLTEVIIEEVKSSGDQK